MTGLPVGLVERLLANQHDAIVLRLIWQEGTFINHQNENRLLYRFTGFGAYVCCYELPKRRHVHYTFEHLRESVGSDSLSTDDVSRLFIKLHFLNCSENKQTEDYRKCFSPTELYNFSGYSVPKAINATEFLKFAPLLVYCLLPAPERNSGRVPCDAPKNHSALFDSFVKNFSKDGEVGITHEALDKILEDVNKTIGVFLSKSKCFSAENVFQEVHGGEHEGEHKDECAHEEEHAHEEEPHDEEEEEQDEEHSHDEHEEEEVLDQEDFRKACASIIFHLVQGFCIEEGHEHNESSHSTLPSKEFFINDIFKDETHLSEEKLEEIFHSLGIGKSESSESGGGSHEGHDHRRKRSVRQEHSQQDGLSLSSHKVYRRATGHDHGPQENGASNATCYSVDELLTVFDVDHSVGADKFDFKELCPALIQQVRSGACIESTVETHEEDKDMGKIWGYGFAAVTIISLTSLVGVATIPFVGKKMYKKILALLVALAVGTLTGDSILHLLPHAFGLHGHDESESGGEHAHENEDTGFILKALVVMVSIYAFFLFETLMHLCLKSKLHEHGGHSHIDDELPGPSNCHISFKKKQSCPIFEHRQVPPLGKTEEKPAVENGDIVLTNMGSPTRTCTNPTDALNGHCLYEYISSTDTEDEPVKTVVSIDHTVLPPHSESIPKKTLKQSLSKRSVFGDEELAHANPLKKISSVAWMIIIGDTLHNISDGLAIGAAFSEGGSLGVSGGISTSIAVFCHELPHELGDFAVLLTAGMSIKMALLANLLSALSCYIGLAIGIYLGQSADVRFWIFAIAAGMFLYVALVDMLPDLMHSESLQTDPVPTFLYQNLGLVVGICIMLVIALYEEELMAIEF